MNIEKGDDNMLKTLGKQLQGFRKDSILTPLFMILEVIMEMIIPLMMAAIIDNGVNKGDIHYIYKTGFLMVIACLLYTSPSPRD